MTQQMTRGNRPPSLLYIPIAALFLALLFLCSGSASAADPKADLIASLKGADVDGYLFSMNEDGVETSASLTNKGLYDVYSLGRGDADLVLRYSSVEDYATGKTSIYKSEIIKSGTSLTLIVTDVATNKAISKTALPVAGPACQPAGQFSSINACIERFRCLNGGALLCNANTTCQPQFAALTCCLTNGQLVSVHLVFNPTSLKCLVRGQLPDLGGLLSQN